MHKWQATAQLSVQNTGHRILQSEVGGMEGGCKTLNAFAQDVKHEDALKKARYLDQSINRRRT